MVVKYKIVADQLRTDILNGFYKEVKKLPTEDELMNMFEVSRNTIRKAIEILVDEGYIYQLQGSGIFLREFSKPGCITMRGVKGLTDEFPTDRLTNELLKLQLIEANEELATKMKCAIGTKIYHVVRLRKLNNEPLAIEESFFNKDVIHYLNNEICDQSIYQYIEEDLKLKIGFADKVIYAEKLTKQEAEILHLDENDPVLVVENMVFLNTGVIFDVSTEKFHYNKMKLLNLVKN